MEAARRGQHRLPTHQYQKIATHAQTLDTPQPAPKKSYIRFTDSTKRKTQITVPVTPPYAINKPKPQLNELGLPIKEFYTTRDVCQVLDPHPDTLRYRLRKKIYPEPKQRAGDKRRYTLDEIKELIKITDKFPRKKWKLKE